ncbi:formate dehydrogenase [Hydrogenophaga sp.]|uniref:formate dehydrogenase n=1 Tax=Hydrogenophaga sp. TaxID=1904254 RepID=UPI003F707AD3
MSKSPRSTPEEGRPNLKRRTLFAGASTVGALAAAATLLPRVAPEEATAAVESKPAPTKGGGYSLSDHVKQYYQTTRI